ncbi:hypothetical protein LWC08_03085 [Desulfobaculum bizertense]|uniref:MATE family efflux transporter n=1 Tax=Desulfobaculum bizertense TaxID=376490 RepID=UPI001EFF3F50|nr:MATE family efflux transporter [Desulfobaculum bizertense]UIJ38568.1 hypothetical protein LWC08_03085 [Desulfobaculum bizertense]
MKLIAIQNFEFDWKLWLALTGAMLVPKIYEMNRVWLVGAMDMSALAIVEQYKFIELIVEILNESFPIAILSLISQNPSRKEALSLLKTAAVFVASISFLLMLGIWFGASYLVNSIGSTPSISNVTREYLRIRGVGLIFDVLFLVAFMGLKARQQGWACIGVMAIGCFASAVVDNFLYGINRFSLGLGVVGVAIGYAVFKFILFGCAWIALLKSYNSTFHSFCKVRWSFHRKIFKISKYSGLDSLVRNGVYIFILTILNSLGILEYGGYGLAMSLIWCGLIPVLALGECASVSLGVVYSGNERERIFVVFRSLFIVLAGLLTTLIAGGFFGTQIVSMFNDHHEIVFYSEKAYQFLLIPYVCFSCGLIVKSIFIGTGNVKYVFLVSLVVAASVSLPGIVCYSCGLWSPHFEEIMLFLGCGMIVDFFCSSYFAYLLLKRI